MQKQNFIQDLNGNFFLRTPKQKAPTLIYFVVKVNHIKIRLATGVKIYPKQWNKRKQKAIISNHYSKLDNHNNTIVNEVIQQYHKKFRDFKDYLSNNPNEIDYASSLLKSFMYIKKTMINPIKYLFNSIENDKTIKSSTKKDYINHLKWFEKYQEIDAINTFNDIDKKYIKKFYDWLCAINNNPRTIDGKLTIGYINGVITILWGRLNSYCVENDLMDSTILNEWESKRRKIWIVKDDTRTLDKSIALTDAEVILLWNYWHKLENEVDKDILAIFLIECLCGQRFSDANKITDNLKRVGNVATIKLVQQKGTKAVNVNVVFKLLLDILDKYNNQMPKTYKVDYTIKTLQKIAKDAGIQGEEEFYRQSGADDAIPIKYNRYECVGTHTARRTFITLLALRGWDLYKIKKYSGHKEIETVEKYVKIKDTGDYEIFKENIKCQPHLILRYIDEEENKKLFNQNGTEFNITEYRKEVLANEKLKQDNTKLQEEKDNLRNHLVITQQAKNIKESHQEHIIELYTNGFNSDEVIDIINQDNEIADNAEL